MKLNESQIAAQALCECGHPEDDHIEETDCYYCLGCTMSKTSFIRRYHRFQPNPPQSTKSGLCPECKQAQMIYVESVDVGSDAPIESNFWQCPVCFHKLSEDEADKALLEEK